MEPDAPDADSRLEAAYIEAWDEYPESTDDRSALMLNPQERADLAELVDHFLSFTDWVDRRLPQYAVPPDHEIQRQRALARRIIAGR